jgi:hypothetical protein
MLPAFNKEHSKSFINPKFKGDIHIEQDDSTFVVSNIYQSTNISWNLPTQLNKDSPVIEPDHNCIIIQKSFIIAVVNLEMLTDFNIPIISASVVSENDFISI